MVTMHGDIDLINQFDFKECPSKSLLQEWVLTKGDYKFMLVLTQSAWVVSTARFGMDGVGKVKQVSEEHYSYLRDALRDVEAFILNNNLEEMNND
ncbi:hypothetical protein ERX27_07610 [Macrococcus brunensis]|uniref:Uncharacterized protein n=1 Tax=Macrococcus brunensis TaxID=198483 RepID=A0A4R6BCY5_9STAP|nr:hypothetical protein [Macrococcus brunensis]TDL96713.1 hypothetical protein ERX27_07610 [Macrococcus brunensis]